MKVKGKIDCIGPNYNIKVGDIKEVDAGTGKILVKFGYVEEIKSAGKPKEPKETKVTE